MAQLRTVLGVGWGHRHARNWQSGSLVLKRALQLQVSLRVLVKEGEGCGQRGCEAQRRAQGGGSGEKGPNCRLQSMHRRRHVFPEVSRFHLVPQLTITDAFNVRAGFVDSMRLFFFYPGSQTGADGVPSFAARWGKFYYMPGSSGPANSPGKESKILPASVLSSRQWKRTPFLLNEPGKPGAF